MKTYVDAPSGTQVLALIEQHCGASARDAFWEWYGGQKLYIPQRAAPDHRLVDLIGIAGARVLGQMHGATMVEVPIAPRNGSGARRQSILSMTLAGERAADIARDLGITERRVRQIQAEHREAGVLPSRHDL